MLEHAAESNAELWVFAKDMMKFFDCWSFEMVEAGWRRVLAPEEFIELLRGLMQENYRGLATALGWSTPWRVFGGLAESRSRVTSMSREGGCAVPNVEPHTAKRRTHDEKSVDICCASVPSVPR